MLVSVIILNWNSEAALLECVGCLSKQAAGRDQVFVLNNGSEDQIIQNLQTDWADLNLFVEQLDANIGESPVHETI